MKSASQIRPVDTEGSDPPYYVKAAFLGIPAYLIGVHLWTWILSGSIFLKGAADFRSFYAAGWALRLGRPADLYNLDFTQRLQDQYVGGVGITLPFTHPPFEALLFAPLAYLSYGHAYLVFLAFNLGLLGITFQLLRPWMQGFARIYRWLPVALFAAFLPVAAALIQGQDSVLLLTLLALVATSLDRRREATAGVFLALALFRFQLTLPMAFLFLLYRRWRFLTGFAGAAVAVTGISVWLMKGATLNYPRTLLNLSVYFDSPENQARFATPVPLQMMPNVRGLIVGITHLSGLWLHVIIFAITAVLLLLAWRARAEGTGLLLLAITVCVPISYHLLIHDLSALLLPLIAVLNRAVESEKSAFARERWRVRVAALVFVSPLLISYAPAHFWLVSIPLLAFAVSECFLCDASTSVQNSIPACS